ncbi:YbfB/YjiJ family MFS transporter [Rugosimonospora africana]|uniref:Major facilitator superfamily (MFS) profile domain-containing protein n=1 Tax=Rugosimonospora africana TaxID=556532 RepID=A0A8J3QQ97_9ACTN|nr:YbfB/YjiJ family MFS transporter [Rugosimonospora africana]GIH14939.1 hypothetical protein Raf01_31110 [Rugosimonospora africana]
MTSPPETASAETKGAANSGRGPAGPLVALGLAAGPVVALGFTRFAYALLLPAMRDQLHWNFAASGGMNTANAIGYVAGAATSAWWARRVGGRAAFVGGILISAVMLLATAATGNYPVLAGIRFVGGAATAVTFVVGSVLAARIHAGALQQRSAFLVALYMSGVGIGIVVSGAVIPAAIAGLGAAGWRLGWLAMGLLAVAAVLPAVWAVRRAQVPAASTMDGHEPADLRRLAPTFGWYILFGAGYVSYMTFVVAFLHAEGLGLAAESAFFILLGAASVIALLTVAFSAGQAVGPLVAGLLSDASGGITGGLWLSVTLLVIAAVVAMFQRDPSRPGAERPAARSSRRSC